MNTWRKNYLEVLGEQKKHKYGAERTNRAGYSFASKLEAEVFDYLCLIAEAGEIRDLRNQPHVFLTDARIEMVPDFMCVDVKLEQEVYYEAKGFETPEWRLKRKLWTVYGPGRLRVFKKGTTSIRQVEEIIPKGYNKKIGD